MRARLRSAQQWQPSVLSQLSIYNAEDAFLYSGMFSAAAPLSVTPDQKRDAFGNYTWPTSAV
jgi:hypothetical protein